MEKSRSILNLAKQLMRELRIAADTIGERGSLRRAETLQKILSRVKQMKPETLGRIVATGHRGDVLGFYPTDDRGSEGALMRHRLAEVTMYLERKSDALRHLQVLASMQILSGMCELLKECPFNREGLWPSAGRR